MTAAIMAAREGASVAVLEHMDTLGKKLLVTGNGKCNFAAGTQGEADYYGANPAFVVPVFQSFGLEEILAFFRELGIEPYLNRGGYYPRSGQASAVAAVLLKELQRLGVHIYVQCGIRSIEDAHRQYKIETKEGNFCGKCCVLATGGRTFKKSGSDGSGFLYLTGLGHHVTPLFPALTGFCAKQTFFREIAGIRIRARLTLFVDEKKQAEETGELQLTAYGLSGIPMFQLAHPAAQGLQNSKTVRVMVDFYPEISMEECRHKLRQRFARFGNGKNGYETCIGLFPDKLIPVLFRQAALDSKKAAGHFSEKELRAFCDQIKAFPVELTAWHTFDQAQVTAGGVDTREIRNDTLESTLHEGLFFAGEMIDIDGKCGGFNLQWAWASGAVAGKNAALRSKERA